MGFVFVHARQHWIVLAALACLLVRPEARSTAAPRRPSTEQATAQRVDRLLEEAWQRDGIRPASAAEPHELLRRLSLDLIGRIPTLEELAKLESDKSPDRVDRAVERLLKDASYASYWATRYSTLLLGHDNRLNKQFQAPAQSYLESVFRDNVPLDRMTRELLATSGDLAVEPELAFVFAHWRGGDVTVLAGETARLFLGLPMQCAQCHDHPYEKALTNQAFLEYAAFFADLRRRGGAAAHIFFDEKLLPTIAQKRVEADRPIKGQPLPQFTLIEPRLLGKPVQGQESRRQELAELIVDDERFALTIVDRTWRELLGSGLANPWDEVGVLPASQVPPALRALAEDFRKAGYDHKWLLRAITRTRAYRMSARSDAAEDRTSALESFAQARMRPLSTDQLLASLFMATGLEESLATRGRWQQIENVRQATLRQYVFTFGEDEVDSDDSFSGNVPQALLLRNHQLTNLPPHPGTRLRELLERESSPERRVERLFQLAYARKPTAEERARFLLHVDEQRHTIAAYEDLWHALLTSSEFITNH